MSQNTKPHKYNSESTVEVNISRFRRAIDFIDGYTDGERIVAGVIADHFNKEKGYCYPTRKYLMEVYGFSSGLIGNTVRKLKSDGLMIVRKWDRNNIYFPQMVRAEAVIAERDVKIRKYHESKRELANDAATHMEVSEDELMDTATSVEVSVPPTWKCQYHERGSVSTTSVVPNVQGNAQAESPRLSFQDATHLGRDSYPLDHAPTAPTGDDNGTLKVIRPTKPRAQSRQSKGHPYRQSKERADNLFAFLTCLQWRKAGDSDDPQFDPSDRSEVAAKVHWNQLLGKGIDADRLVAGAERFIQTIPESQRPTLTGWLSRYAECCLDPEEVDLFVPEGECQPEDRNHANDNQRLAMAAGDGSTYGGQCEPDAPF